MTTDRNDPVDWDAYESELSNPDTAAPVLVDSTPDLPFTAGPRSESRKPVLPGWLKSARTFKDTAKWAAGYAWHTFAFHLVRTPVYSGKLLVRSPVGLFRLVRGGFRWGFDMEGEPVRKAAVRREDAAEYLKLSAQRDNRVRLRVFLAMLGLVTCCCVSWWVLTIPAWQRFALLGLAMIGLGLLGAPADRPLLSRAVVTARVAKLTSDVVVRAP
ncbi:MAG TPA: cell division protein FtsK, partial [Micromonosporaceae bacterium]|nr:cell division protein FtsK [Micromonosporaceae bacterium]